MRPGLRRLALTIAIAIVAAAALPLAYHSAATAAGAPTPAAKPRPPAAPTATDLMAPAARQLALDLNKSQMLRLARPARDVLVANPLVADVVLRTADTAFVIGKKVGETNVYFFDVDGRQIEELEINVAFDSAAVVEALKRTIPNEQIDISSANQSLVLTGSVASQQASDRAQQVARQFVADDKSIINLLNIRNSNQVLLRVRVTEMSRNVVKELGITPGFPVPLSFNINGANFTLTGNSPGFTQTPFFGLTTGPAAVANAAGVTAASVQFSALLQALESNGLVKTLAEPNLTAVSGETASFLVGGEFPVPTPASSTSGVPTVAITYKDFGVQLTFTPVVLSGGMISLRIATEVSQLSPQNSVTIAGAVVPGLTVRRAQTTVELPTGGSIALAGLLQDDIQNTIQGVPGLKDVPILGTLFSSKQFQRSESDLVIAVTPFLVKPTDPTAIAYPTDGFGPASDFNMYFLGRLNATYSKPAPDDVQEHAMSPLGIGLKSPFGFILE